MDAQGQRGKSEPFKNAVTVASLGKHVVKFRSGDGAENEEAVKSVAFEITAPKVEPTPDPGTPQPGTPPAGNLPGTNPPDAMPHTKPTAAKLKRLAATTTGKFAKRGLKVSTVCEAGFTGKATISVSKAEGRKLGLKKATTLVSKAITCGASDSATATLKLSKKLQRAFSKSKKAVTLTVKVTLGTGSMATSSSQRLKLKPGK